MRYLSVVLALYLCACASSLPAVAGADAPDNIESTAVFLFDPFDPPIDRSIVTEDAVEKLRLRFGEPEIETRKVGPDRRDPTTTLEHLVWSYEGLTISLEGFADGAGQWITKIVVDGGQHTLKYGLGVGVDRDEFLEHLVPALFNNDAGQIRFSSAYTDYGLYEEQEFSVQTNVTLLVDFDAEEKATKLTWQYFAD